jgi:hypothetical protein
MSEEFDKLKQKIERLNKEQAVELRTRIIEMVGNAEKPNNLIAASDWIGKVVMVHSQKADGTFNDVNGTSRTVARITVDGDYISYYWYLFGIFPIESWVTVKAVKMVHFTKV